jgi:hypothetical protein
MFGVVPKALWSRVKACDEQNCVRMGTNALLIADGREPRRYRHRRQFDEKSRRCTRWRGRDAPA